MCVYLTFYYTVYIYTHETSAVNINIFGIKLITFPTSDIKTKVLSGENNKYDETTNSKI